MYKPRRARLRACTFRRVLSRLDSRSCVVGDSGWVVAVGNRYRQHIRCVAPLIHFLLEDTQMVVPYEIREQDGKWQVLGDDPPKSITCQTKAYAQAIAHAPVLVHKVEDLGERGEDLAKRLDLASKAIELSMVGNEMIGTCPLSRHYSALAAKALGEENE